MDIFLVTLTTIPWDKQFLDAHTLKWSSRFLLPIDCPNSGSKWITRELVDSYRTIPGTNRTPGQFPTVIILLSYSEKMKGHLKQLMSSRCNQHFDNLLFFKRENHKLFLKHHKDSSLIVSVNFSSRCQKMTEVLGQNVRSC